MKADGSGATTTPSAPPVALYGGAWHPQGAGPPLR